MLAVISGGSQGLGLGIAEQYIEKGYDVVLVARTESKLKEAVAKLGERASYVVADVSSPKECTEVFQRIKGVPDLVICCAGAARPGFFIELTTDELAKNLKTVYETALYFSHAALKVMANAQDKHEVRRRLVYCSSTVSVFPFIGYSAYAPAKAAIRSLVDIVRQESMEHNVHVSHIMPGTMDTEGYAIEEQTKPEITRQIEGASKPLPAITVARQVVKELEAGSETIYTDTISWVLGSMMMGITPRTGTGFLQTIVGLVLVLVAPIIRFFIHSDIKKSFKTEKKSKRS